MNEWRRPKKAGPGADRERAYLAASKRKDRSLDQRLKSAVDASKVHYERTGRCFNITREIVQEGGCFDELDDKEEFFNPNLLLPEGVSAVELWKDHLKAVSGVEYEGDFMLNDFGQLQAATNQFPAGQMNHFLMPPSFPFTNGYASYNGNLDFASQTSNGTFSQMSNATFDSLLSSQPSQNYIPPNSAFATTSQTNGSDRTEETVGVEKDEDEINFDDWLK
jgi:hypothetical protein